MPILHFVHAEKLNIIVSVTNSDFPVYLFQIRVSLYYNYSSHMLSVLSYGPPIGCFDCIQELFTKVRFACLTEYRLEMLTCSKLTPESGWG